MYETKHRRKGQTLAEFALTLPILLLLTFGVVEFGRLFQAWVTIQNAAREAARYATTGQIEDDKYNLDEIIPCYIPDEDEVVDEPGVLYAYQPPSTAAETPTYHIEVFGKYDPISESYIITPENLFATWYDGLDCDPGSPEHGEMRRDIVRLASIMDVARQGAAGLTLEENQLNGTRSSIQRMLYDQWENPMPRSDQRGYFNVSVCSSRGFLDAESTGFDPLSPRQRFVTVYEESSIPAGVAMDYAPPYCMLNEQNPDVWVDPDTRTDLQPIGARDVPANFGRRWLDAGGPGDRVTVFITFNHPLITPLGLAEYVKMEARRSGVNESFRSARALNAVQGSPPGQGDKDTPTPIPTDTPVDTPIPPTATDRPTDIPPPTATDEPASFDCDALWIGNMRFYQQRALVEINNAGNPGWTTQLRYLKVRWIDPYDYQDALLTFAGMGPDVFWEGRLESDLNPTELLDIWDGDQFKLGAGDWMLDTSEFTDPADLDRWATADKRVYGGEIKDLQLVFQNAGLLQDTMEEWMFTGTEIRFVHPQYPTDPGRDCIKRINNDVDVVPDDTPIPDFETEELPPDCINVAMDVEWGGFDIYGVVKLTLINDRDVPSPLLGFNITYPDPVHAGFTSSKWYLNKITIGGTDAEDPDGWLLWSNGDPPWVENPRGPKTLTEGGASVNMNQGDGYYYSVGEEFEIISQDGGDPITTQFENVAYMMPPHTSATMYLQFNGTPLRPDSAWAWGQWSFYGTYFDFGCEYRGDGGSGPGYGRLDRGRIRLDDAPRPNPTDIPAPTDPPRPTVIETEETATETEEPTTPTTPATDPDLVLSATCEEGSAEPSFTIRNDGGDMTSSKTVTIILDGSTNVTPGSNSFDLNEGKSKTFSVSGFGFGTYVLTESLSNQTVAVVCAPGADVCIGDDCDASDTGSGQ